MLVLKNPFVHFTPEVVKRGIVPFWYTGFMCIYIYFWTIFSLNQKWFRVNFEVFEELFIGIFSILTFWRLILFEFFNISFEARHWIICD